MGVTKRHGQPAITKRDLQAMVVQIGREHRLDVSLRTTFKPEGVTVVGECRRPSWEPCTTPVYVAKHTIPLHSAKPMEAVMYAVLWDLYSQCERGVVMGFPSTETYMEAEDLPF